MRTDALQFASSSITRTHDVAQGHPESRRFLRTTFCQSVSMKSKSVEMVDASEAYGPLQQSFIARQSAKALIGGRRPEPLLKRSRRHGRQPEFHASRCAKRMRTHPSVRGTRHLAWARLCDPNSWRKRCPHSTRPEVFSPHCSIPRRRKSLGSTS